jgi:site-specific recombinase
LEAEATRIGVQSQVRHDLQRLTLRFNASESLDAQMRRAGQLFAFVWEAPDAGATAERAGLWLDTLDEDGPMKSRFQARWFRMLGELKCVSLFAESGLPRHNGLMAEAMRRIFERLLPSARGERDAGRLFAAIFSSRRAVERFLTLPDAVFGRLEQLLRPGDDAACKQQLSHDVREGLCLLAARVCGRGATEAVRQRSSAEDFESSPFYELLFRTRRLVDGQDAAERARESELWTETVGRCREELYQVHVHMEDAGVSSTVVFDLRSIEATLDRMELLADFFVRGEAQEHGSAAGRSLLRALVRGRFEDTRLSYLFQQNLNLLARKTVERTGRGGEHSIAHTHAEYGRMWVAAAGGGFLTVFTAALKMKVLEGHFPLFVEGLFISLDYSISFLFLQIFGFALATKQPSMTAATLAGIVRDNRGVARYSKIAEFAADICRTQLAAAFGNIITVCLGAVAFEAVWARLFKTHYLPQASAQHVYQTLHPFTSGTAIFAAFTGVLLWMAAMTGGWAENFLVYHRIPEAIRQHPIGARVGAARMERFGDWLERNIAGWSTSLSLGMLLGFSPVLARFFGIPLDVRHVTLSTGTLALAAARFGTSSFRHGWFYFAVAGIGVTFILNLSVSFAIASIVALRAYDIPRREQLKIAGYIVRDFLQAPLAFVVPEKIEVLTISERKIEPPVDIPEQIT